MEYIVSFSHYKFFIQTNFILHYHLDGNISNLEDKKNENKDSVEPGVTNEDAETLEKPSDKFEISKTPLKKRKRASWQRGLLKKKKRRILNNHSQVSRINASKLPINLCC